MDWLLRIVIVDQQIRAYTHRAYYIVGKQTKRYRDWLRSTHTHTANTYLMETNEFPDAQHLCVVSCRSWV